MSSLFVTFPNGDSVRVDQVAAVEMVGGMTRAILMSGYAVQWEGGDHRAEVLDMLGSGADAPVE